MNNTRRAFLGSASRALLAPVLGSALLNVNGLGCAGSRDAEPEEGTGGGDPLTPPKPAVRRTFRPPRGRVLFITGQGSAQIGRRPADGMGDGYLDHVPTRPGGFTLYCSIANPVDLPDLSRTCDLPALRDSVLHLSVGWVADSDRSTQGNNKAITTGAFDEHIDRLAEWCAAQPRPILMRIGYEFDRGVPFRDFHYDPAYFADGFRRLVDRLRAAGARNVASVLASTNAPGFSPVLTQAAFDRFYPGDDYVEWLGCSMWSPTDVDHVILAEARRRDKPVLLAETTPMKFNIGRGAIYPTYIGLPRKATAQAIWDGWHQPIINFIQSNLDVIAGWHYIAADWSTDPYWNWVPLFTNCDARPWGTPEFLEIWNRHMNAGPFVQASAGLFGQLGY